MPDTFARTISKDSICVVIAARNAEATIARAVESALDEPDVAEVVVVDDGSDDRTSQVARDAGRGSGRLLLIRTDRNLGPSAARNAAIAASRSPILCVLDADDYFLPGRLTRLLEAAGTDWDLVADDLILVKGSVPADLASYLPARACARTLTLEAFVRGNIGHRTARRRELGFLKPLMRRGFLTTSRLRYDETMFLGEDYALYVEALASGATFKLVSACGYVAVERDNSLSGRHRTCDLERIVAFDDAFLARRTHLTPPERQAIAAHGDATRRKWQHRRVLDQRKRAGYPAAFIELLREPRAWSYILAATARTKLSFLDAWTREEANGTRPRLLLGE